MISTRCCAPAARSWPLALLLVGIAEAARAGAPYLTDDPEPVELHRTEINLAAQGSRVAGGSSGSLAADINHGCAAETQCHVAIPLAFSHANGEARQTGVGDVELGAKIRFVNDTATGVMAAVYPTVFLPTGNAARGLGNGRTQLLLPVWLQKSSGPWVLDGGASYLVNPAAGARNSWFVGLLARRSLSDRVSVGAELFHRSPVANDAPATTGFNVGATVKLTESVNLLASVGRGLQGASANRGSFYLACQLEL